MSTNSLQNLSADQLFELKQEITTAYAELKSKNLKLDLTRGKPSVEQLNFSNHLLALPGEDSYHSEDGTDVRNYGGLIGIPEIRQLWADALDIPVDQVISADASSLNIEFDVISWAMTFGVPNSPRPWKDEPKVKWICPVPGYDRHFSITEHFGIEMIPVAMNVDGPDMAAVAELVQDPAVKGMWVVPAFSNPTGYTVSEEVARQLAELDTAAPDFSVMWDNAYALHTLTKEFPSNIDIVSLAAQAGHPNRFWAFGSTSKITFAGAGVSFLITSPDNRKWYTQHAGIRGIGPNKVNQLAHAKFFGDADGLRAHMLKHSESLAPKFSRVLEILDTRLGQYGVAQWTNPSGGYFISVDFSTPIVSRVVELAKQAGIALTPAGSSFPLHSDPEDKNIRLAPSMPPMSELEPAMDGFATCVLLASLEKLAEF